MYKITHKDYEAIHKLYTMDTHTEIEIAQGNIDFLSNGLNRMLKNSIPCTLDEPLANDIIEYVDKLKEQYELLIKLKSDEIRKS